MKNIKQGVYTYNDKSFNFNFATDLSAYRKLLFVNYAVNSLVSENRYDYIVKDLIFDFSIVAIFTDIDTSFINARDEDDNIVNPIVYIEHFLENTNVVEIVKANMEVGLYDELEDAVDKAIEYRTGIHPNPVGDALGSLFSTIEKKVNELDFDSVMGMAQKFADISGELTPDAIVNAYMNSDVHKKNMEEIIESKEQKKVSEFTKSKKKAKVTKPISETETNVENSNT